jgi:hypothetical protein
MSMSPQSGWPDSNVRMRLVHLILNTPRRYDPISSMRATGSILRPVASPLVAQ